MEEKKLSKFTHRPVLLEETIEGLNCRKGLIYVDATLGGGGHSAEIAKRIHPDGMLICLDVDPDALNAGRKKLEPWNDIVTIVKGNYSKLPEILKALNIEKITGGILFDLGASYHQFITAERGFSFSKAATLDMRFDPDNPITAYTIVNTYSESELSRIFKDYGEERFAKKIARKIIERREKHPIKTTVDLADLVKSITYSPKYKIHPATRVFQALRIAVNNELINFENTLIQVIPLLGKDARIAVISFHSLEDRLVKNAFKYYSSNCKCPQEQLICRCGDKELEVITKKPIVASSEEIEENPPSRSAKLRVAQRI